MVSEGRRTERLVEGFHMMWMEGKRAEISITDQAGGAEEGLLY